MPYQVTKHSVLSGFFWTFMGRWGTQGMHMVVGVILARLLLPEDYGIIALVGIFIAVAGTFVTGGFAAALIQKKDASETDFSSVFYINLLVAFFFCLILFFASPAISSFYEEPKLVPVLRVLSLSLIFGAFNSIQNAVIAREMKFKKLFFSSIGAIIPSGIAGIYMAYAGFGVWALVVQTMTSQLAITLILWLTVRWRPRLLFSFERVKTLFTFGWKLLISGLLDTLYRNIRSLFIGKIYNSEMLGYFNRGSAYPLMVVDKIDGSIQAVLFPTFASMQDNIPKFKDTLRRAITTSTFLLFPIMILIGFLAHPLVEIILTEKWLPAVPFMQIFCAVYALRPISTSNLQAIKALGRSNIFLKLEIIKKVLGISILAISLPYGVYAIALGGLVSGVISTIINAYPNTKLLKYSYREQLKDILPSLILSLSMGIFVFVLGMAGMPMLQGLIVQIIAGVVFYYFMAKMFKLECLSYILSSGKGFLNARKNR